MPAQPKLNDATIGDICSCIRAGSTFRAACQYSGVNYHTAYEWLRQGMTDADGTLLLPGRSRYRNRVDREIYRRFAEQVENAKGVAELKANASITRAMDDDWRAAAWWLERINQKNEIKKKVK